MEQVPKVEPPEEHPVRLDPFVRDGVRVCECGRPVRWTGYRYEHR